MNIRRVLLSCGGLVGGAVLAFLPSAFATLGDGPSADSPPVGMNAYVTRFASAFDADGDSQRDWWISVSANDHRRKGVAVQPAVPPDHSIEQEEATRYHASVFVCDSEGCSLVHSSSGPIPEKGTFSTDLSTGETYLAITVDGCEIDVRWTSETEERVTPHLSAGGEADPGFAKALAGGALRFDAAAQGSVCGFALHDEASQHGYRLLASGRADRDHLAAEGSGPAYGTAHSEGSSRLPSTGGGIGQTVASGAALVVAGAVGARSRPWVRARGL